MCDTNEPTNATEGAIHAATTEKDLINRGVFALCEIGNKIQIGTDRRQTYESSLADCRIVPFAMEGLAVVMLSPRLDLQDDVDHVGVVKAILENALEICFTDIDYSERLGDLHFPYEIAHLEDDIVFVLRTAV